MMSWSSAIYLPFFIQNNICNFSHEMAKISGDVTLASMVHPFGPVSTTR